ncbi:MAG: sulfatase [Desulfobacula sp.]|uniref:sulfatase family protein n=1 Tax=Desulfobacula sp. TaxID=2593537 RepID=UPI0025BFEAD9|nr:sulfatase [Desulfobacula sp.]MCD4718903.1 sulfatase [Desulfobacula sp.]
MKRFHSNRRQGNIRLKSHRTLWMWVIVTLIMSSITLTSFSNIVHAKETKKPNIVFILSDDHRWNHMGFMDHPWIQTPNMDRMAKEGIVFNNAFCTTSLCSPSRASFVTGQYAHKHGVTNNITPWNNKNVTVLELMKKGGYKTAFIGKWHMPGHLPELRGVDRFITFTAKTGQGQYFDCPLIIDGVETQRKGKYIGKDLTDFAIEFINKEKDNTFCLYLAHKAPHGPFKPPPELKNFYEDKNIDHLPKWAHRYAGMCDGGIYGGVLWNVEAQYKRYCSLITSLDQQVGRVIDELERLGIADNTIVIYSTDNGYFFGDKGHFDKRWAYEPDLRIPFIVKYPAGIKDPGNRSDKMILNVDLAPTLLDLAGISVPAYMDGKSILPILEGQSITLREDFHYEFFKDFPPYTVPGIDAVRTNEFLYIEYNESRMKPELYNILKDPGNIHNLMETPEGAKVLPGLKIQLEEYKRRKRHG